MTHAAITENKRLGAVLEAVKEMQDAAAPKVTTVGKQRTRYQPTGRRRKPQKSWMDGRAARRAAEANCPAFSRDGVRLRSPASCRSPSRPHGAGSKTGSRKP